MDSNESVTKETESKIFSVLVLHSIFSPLQGFWNLLIYKRRKYIKYRRENPDETRWQASLQAFFYAGDDNGSPSRSRRYSSRTTSTRRRQEDGGCSSELPSVSVAVEAPYQRRSLTSDIMDDDDDNELAVEAPLQHIASASDTDDDVEQSSSSEP
eukprot:CAMPEP_0194040160 /NCGR_PEP_ID=MMETSP0009_2-20130614/12208_1 /TAXON_ID=210454 /ORGANISM="Grammatophora oceanica, Strain CCMP 410" /LENGTH=154 /DNA_ID=CAMNT_0038683209 /DNA_START=182 /DNA_END=646 /DNA_ORIENTATION=+